MTARKMTKRKKVGGKTKVVVDSFLPKKPRGRPGIPPSWVQGTADNDRVALSQYWDVIGEPLIRARTPQEVTAAFQGVPEGQRSHFVPSLAEMILNVLREPLFPKTSEAQIKFLADSLGARGQRSARRSRDICAKERKKVQTWIVRRDFYIQCTCGYEGPALRGACPKCKTDQVHPSAKGIAGWGP